jgi:hypothetical protein
MALTLSILQIHKYFIGNTDCNKSHKFSYVILVKILPDNGFVEASGFLELALLHEEYVGHVQLPDVTLVAKLHALAEQLFNLFKDVEN